MEKEEKLVNIFKDETCEFEYGGRVCISKDIVGIARCKLLCKTHLRTVINDNRRKFVKDIDILDDMTFTRDLCNAETWSNTHGKLNTKEVKNGN